ncbi:MAG: cytidylate kinase-like family protein [Lachnospiraceae bacterium]|nr:cytidylate kinase-like family protein [Lachnospiraceae bacterium]
MRKIICIGRQFGSGGHLIARKIAEQTGMEYYDKKLFEYAVETSGFTRNILEHADECMANPLLQPIYYEGNSKKYYGKNANDILFEVQKELILKAAETKDCVFVGRCADDILKKYTDYFVKSIFFTAPMEYRIQRTMANDGLDEKAASVQVRKMDKKRSAYYNYYTGRDWGKPSDYNYCINTAENSEKEIMDLLLHIYEQK